MAEQTKICSKCKESQPLSQFSPRRSASDGKCSNCHACRSLYQKDFRTKNRELVNSRSRKRRAKNREKTRDLAKKGYYRNIEKRKIASKKYKLKNADKIAAQNRQFYIDNREHHLKVSKAWGNNNKGKLAAYCAKYRATKLKATPNWLTKEHYIEIDQFYIDAKYLQWLSEDLLVVDHVVPLQGKTVSGLHVPWNLQIMNRSENSRKSNKLQEGV